MVERAQMMDRGLKVIITATGASCIAYFSGPYAAMIARELYSLGYGYLYGIPSFLSVENLTVYSPMREHVGHVAYNYGAGTLALLSMPLLYKSWDAIKWCFGFSSSKPKPSDDQFKHLDNRLDELAGLLQHHQPEVAKLVKSRQMIYSNSSASTPERCVLEMPPSTQPKKTMGLLPL